MKTQFKAYLYSWLIARVEEQNAKELCEQLKLALHREVADLDWRESCEILDLKNQLEARILTIATSEERNDLIAQFRKELIEVAGWHNAEHPVTIGEAAAIQCAP